METNKKHIASQQKLMINNYKGCESLRLRSQGIIRSGSKRYRVVQVSLGWR